MRMAQLTAFLAGKKYCMRCSAVSLNQAKFCSQCGLDFSPGSWVADAVFDKWVAATLSFYKEVMGIAVDPNIFDRVPRPRPKFFNWPLYDEGSFDIETLLDRAFPGKYNATAINLSDFPKPSAPTLVLVKNLGQLELGFNYQTPVVWRKAGRTFMSFRERCLLGAIHSRFYPSPLEREFVSDGVRKFQSTLCPFDIVKPSNGNCVMILTGTVCDLGDSIVVRVMNYSHRENGCGPRQVIKIF